MIYNPFAYNPSACNSALQYAPPPLPKVSQNVEQCNLISPIQTLPKQPHIVQPKPMGVHAQQSNSAYPMIQGFILVDRNTISPPLYACAGSARSINRVDLMDPYQTGNWISTLGRFKGWKEGEIYAKSFRDNSITGLQLRELNSKMLEEQLGMSDSGHRKELLSIIKTLFIGFPHQGSNSVIPAPQPLIASAMGSACGSEHIASIQTPQPSDIDYGIKSYHPSPLSSVRRFGESDGESTYSHVSATPCPTDQLYPNLMLDPSNREWTADTAYSADVEGNGLSMTTMDDGLGMTTMAARKSYEVWSEASGSIRGGEATRSMRGETARSTRSEGIRSMPRETVGSVQCEPTGSVRREPSGASSIRSTRRSSCKKLILILRPDQIQDDASVIRQRFRFFDVTVTPVEGSDDSYLLAFKDSQMAQAAFNQADKIGYKLVKKWPLRPNPKRPIEYRSLHALQIREGKAFSGKEKGILKAGETVTVNQLKGRRARLIKEVDGEIKSIGWVSVHTQEGHDLLVQVAEL